MRLVLVLSLLLATAVLASADEDYYDLLGLGVERDEATEREITGSWRKLSKKHHPDLAGEGSRELYQKIQRAYEVLGDRKKRKVYDIRGEEGVKQLESPNGGQHHDPFAALFGHGGGGGGGGAKRGSNLNMLMLVNLEDIYNGAAHTVKFNKQKICRTCRGTGAASKEDLITCRECGGSGHTVQTIQIMPGFHTQQQAPCPKCQGKGKSIGKKCPSCDGRKITKGKHTLGIDIEMGVPENYELVYDMEADQSPDEIPGDVIFTVSTAPHPIFTRKGNDLEASFNLTLREALLGFEKKLTHLDGHEVEIDEPSVVQFNQQYVIKDEGLPIHHVPSEKGTLTVTYKVILPESLTEAQAEAIRTHF
jgi:DnaJ-related protein SCJ1